MLLYYLLCLPSKTTENGGTTGPVGLFIFQGRIFENNWETKNFPQFYGKKIKIMPNQSIKILYQYWIYKINFHKIPVLMEYPELGRFYSQKIQNFWEIPKKFVKDVKKCQCLLVTIKKEPNWPRLLEGLPKVHEKIPKFSQKP